MDLNLKVEGLTKRYGDFALDNVSFELPEGCIMGFVGENGAGKTTTIKLILNLIRRDAGSVKVFGLDNLKEERRIKADLGVVLDESSFHDSLRPADISRIFAGIYPRWSDSEFKRLMDRFSLPGTKTVKDYSKGMRTKLSIAAALAHDPRLLILDEPTGGLDPVARSEILDIFMDYIQNERNSILFSSHITTDLERVADYITFISHGKVVLSESKDEIIDSYGLLHCGSADLPGVDKNDVAGMRQSRFGCDVLVKNKSDARRKYAGMPIDDASIEDIMLFYARGQRS